MAIAVAQTIGQNIAGIRFLQKAIIQYAFGLVRCVLQQPYIRWGRLWRYKGLRFHSSGQSTVDISSVYHSGHVSTQSCRGPASTGARANSFHQSWLRLTLLPREAYLFVLAAMWFSIKETAEAGRSVPDRWSRTNLSLQYSSLYMLGVL